MAAAILFSVPIDVWKSILCLVEPFLMDNFLRIPHVFVH